MSTVTAVDHQLARLLAEQATRRGSGVIHAVRGKLKRLFCFDKGWLTYAASNLVEEQFDQALIEQRVLPKGAVESAQEHARTSQKKLSAFLLEQGFPSREVLESGMERHVRGLLDSTLEWPVGEYRFAKGRPDLAGEVTVRIPAVSLVLEHLTRHPAELDEVRVRIGPPNIRPARATKGRRLIDGITLQETASYLVDRCDGKHELGQLIEESPGSEDETLRAIYGLLLLEVLVPAEPEPQLASTREVTVTREECLARLDQAKGASDHYQVLGVYSTASRDEIREAYYYLARRFHPDRLRSGPLQDLRGRFEAYFSRVTQAYNTLYDLDERADYDRLQEEEARGKKAEPEKDAGYLAKQNFARGRVLIQRRRWQDAVIFLENALQLDDSRSEYHLELGRVLIRNPRQRADAERHLLSAVELDPTAAEGFLALGELYAKTSRRDEAVEMYREVLRWEPANEAAREALTEMGERAEPREGGILGGLFKK